MNNNERIATMQNKKISVRNAEIRNILTLMFDYPTK